MARKQYDSETHHVVISSPHDELHRGNGFSTFYDTGSIANDATGEVLINVGSTGLHIQAVVGATGTFLIEIFESPTVTSNGTELTIFNKNRYSSRTSNAACFHTPSTTDDGTKIDMILVPGGKREGGMSEMSKNDLFIFNGQLSYLVRTTNISGAANRGVINIEWYEPYLGA